MDRPLTPKQERVLRFIRDSIQRLQAPPSIRDIAGHFGVSIGTVQDHIGALERKGVLKRDQSRARGIRLPASFAQIPILGRVHAGNMSLAFEDVDGYVPYESKQLNSHHFALRVRGDSMEDAGIHDGDIVIVRKQQLAEAGNIVVALIDDETTIKYFRHTGRQVFLEPGNPRYKPIYSPHIKIIGKVIEVRRKYE